jgi:hypothetical protein
MTPRTTQCEVFWAFLLNSKHSGVPEDSKSPTLGVGVSSSHFTQSGVATFIVFSNNLNALLYVVWIHGMETKQYGIKIIVVT